MSGCFLMLVGARNYFCVVPIAYLGIHNTFFINLGAINLALVINIVLFGQAFSQALLFGYQVEHSVGI